MLYWEWTPKRWPVARRVTTSISVMHVDAAEVLMQEEGLWGSHYTAKILEVTKQKTKIEFEVRNALHSATHPSAMPLHSATHDSVGLRQE